METECIDGLYLPVSGAVGGGLPRIPHAAQSRLSMEPSANVTANDPPQPRHGRK
jgi:hypothetical protein